MSIKEIAERHAIAWNHSNVPLPEAMERAIREAAAPLVEALERVQLALETDGYAGSEIPQVIEDALAEIEGVGK